MFLTIFNRIKFSLSLNDKTSQKAKTILAVCSMLTIFLQEVMYQALMPAGWLENYFNSIQAPNTGENNCRYNLKIVSRNISQPKISKQYLINRGYLFFSKRAR